MTTINMSLNDIHELSLHAFNGARFSAEQAQAVAQVVTRAEADHCRSHGLYRVPGYVSAVRSGRANGRATPSVQHQAASVLYVNGDRGFAPLAAEAGRSELIAVAKRQGIAAMALGNTHHFSALWADLEPIVDAGLVAWCFVVGQCAVAPHGGRSRLMGTNPIGFGWPRPDGGSFIFDFATSAAARGEVELKRLADERIPEGWGVDAEGLPTTDPAEALAGALLPFGGYKGSALSMMVELIAGPLIREKTSREVAGLGITDGGPPPGGELYVVIDPAAFGSDARTIGETFFNEATSQPGVRLPSARRHAARLETHRNGVEVPSELIRQIEDLSRG
ncbi:Ldh family oxidoreductase [Ensifer adhaerens]|uniref:Ldh family oxidoreductase n=1 Tax=Ensifer adhaerens TaxID=106592 RepID=UPI001CC17873|nr:Ldh family oxidoreductase [Ensifer adhaerens]MBZ7926547.1 Ldh family oxidoreductase [Ensifer adhaerens]